MLIHIYILCMYLILSILITMGESIQFPKPESEIRSGWGISYNYIGQMHHNLNKYDVVVGLEIPDFRVIPYYQPFSRDSKYCNQNLKLDLVGEFHTTILDKCIIT